MEAVTDLPIPAEAIEAAIDCYMGKTGSCREQAMEAALRATFDALGMEVERREAKMDAAIPHSPAYRLVSRWFPVKP